MTFPSKKDYDAVVHADPVPGLLVAVAPVLTAGLLLWMYASTVCDIRPPHLVARCGPFWFTIPLKAIVEVRENKGVSLDLVQTFALSHDKLVIKYRKANGRMAWFGVAVSPEDKEGFFRELAREVPGLGGEGVVAERA